MPFVFVIIPAHNEEQSIHRVIDEIPVGLVTEIIVVNNASTDATAERAERAGATVLTEPTPGYGRACLKGIEYLKAKAQPNDIVVFLDGDYSDYPEHMTELVSPVETGRADLVVGSRALGTRAKGSMTFPQRFGNWLATSLLRLLYKVRFSDLGPFRAIRYESLVLLGMQDQTYGWTVEMQLKAAKLKLKCMEVPVNYRRRIGLSKISGTIKGAVMAGYKILYTIFRYA